MVLSGKFPITALEKVCDTVTKTGSPWANRVQMGPWCTYVRGVVFCPVSAKAHNVCLLSLPRPPLFVFLLLAHDSLRSA